MIHLVKQIHVSYESWIWSFAFYFVLFLDRVVITMIMRSYSWPIYFRISDNDVICNLRDHNAVFQIIELNN